MQKRWLLLLLLFPVLLQAQEVDVLHYHFSINLTDESDSVSGRAEIRLVNRTGGPVQLDLIQPAPEGTGMRVLKVESGDYTAPYPFSQENNKLVLPVIKGIPGDTLLFRVFYKGVPKDGLIISKNKFGERTFFADNWPNRARHWIPCADRPDDKASVAFTVSAPSHYQVVSNGIKTEEKNSGAQTITTWQEDKPLPTKVMVIGAARFAVKTFADSPPQVPVSGWVYPQDSTKGFYDYGLAPQILRFFSQYVAPFAFSKLANVQSTTIFGGMENASAIFYAENSVTGDRSSESLLAHEIAHQWFGDAASEKSFRHVWLSEGFATYLTHLHFEQKYGQEELRKRLKNDREEIIDFARKNNRPVVDSGDNLMALLNVNSYQKGGWVLHMLRKEVGDSTFQKIIQTYYHQYTGSNADTKDFQQVAKTVSGKDLNWFFEQWLYRPGVPKLHLTAKQEKGKVLVHVIQRGTSYQLPLALVFTTKGGTERRHKISVSKAEEVFELQAPSLRPVDVLLDPDTELLFEQVSSRNSKARSR
jgi:aminopeptidase N